MLFEDDDLLAVSKPPGMSVHGGAGEKGPTLIDLLRAAYRGPSLDLVHRLDRATSGLIVLAKSSAVASSLGRAWEDTQKTYLAIAFGRIAGDRVIDAPIEERHETKSARTIVHPRAILDALEPKTTFCSIELGTGRTHQIRIHLSEIGHPLVNDEKHGDFAANKAWSRAVKDALAARGAAASSRSTKQLMLHSYRLDLTHPRRNERVPLTADPPETWAEIVAVSGGAVDGLHEFP